MPAPRLPPGRGAGPAAGFSVARGPTTGPRAAFTPSVAPRAAQGSRRRRSVLLFWPRCPPPAAGRSRAHSQPRARLPRPPRTALGLTTRLSPNTLDARDPVRAGQHCRSSPGLPSPPRRPTAVAAENRLGPLPAAWTLRPGNFQHLRAVQGRLVHPREVWGVRWVPRTGVTGHSLRRHTGQELTKRVFIRSKKNLRGLKYEIDTKTLHLMSEERDVVRPCGVGHWPSTSCWLRPWASTGHSAARPVGRPASPGRAAC